MLKLTCFLCLAALAAALPSCPKFPDNTDTKLFWTNCNKDDIIQANTITVKDDDGATNYPIDVNKPVVITAKSTNKGPAIQKLLADVKLYYWGGLLGCSWHRIPDFGLLSNLDGCEIGGNCPLGAKTDLSVVTRVDLSKYAKLITLLTSGSPYKLEIHIKSADTADHKEVSCIGVEAVIGKSK